MRKFLLFACAIVATLAVRVAHADTQVRLLATWPADGAATLHHNQNFYLRFAYTSGQPVHIWVQPYFQGKKVRAGSNTSRTYPAGSGEAIGWFFLFDAGAQVDEVRVQAGDGSYNRTPVVATFPVSVGFDDALVDEAPKPDWVSGLLAAEKAAQDAAYQQAMNTPPSPGDMVLVRGFMLAVLAAFAFGMIAPLWCVWRWRDGWRIAAALPAIAMGFVILRIVVDGMRDPTSHNLWPFEIVMWGGMGSAYMLLLLVARWFLVRRAPRR